MRLFELKEGVTAKDVVEAFNTCIKNAQQTVQFREHHATKAKRVQSDPNYDLRRTVKRLMKQILGPSFKLSTAKNKELVEVTVSDNINIISIAEHTEREALVNMIKAITAQAK